MDIKEKIKIPKIHKNEINEFIKKIGKKSLKNFKYYNNPNKLEKNNQPYKAEIYDLYFLYKLITLNKRLSLLEFGSGWSTLALSIGLHENKKKYINKVKHLRFEKPFSLTTVDNEKKFLNITKKRIEKFYKNKQSIEIKYHYSNVEMCIYDSRICHEYSNLPVVNPDFIYLDGPDQFNIKGKINNFHIGHDDLMPMSLDILKFEFYLRPGTIIVADGRGANVEFLRMYLKRKWLTIYLKKLDMHIFYLDAKPIGPPSIKILNFYKN